MVSLLEKLAQLVLPTDKMVAALEARPESLAPLIALLFAAWLYWTFVHRGTVDQGGPGTRRAPTCFRWEMPDLGRFEMGSALIRFIVLLYALFFTLLYFFALREGLHAPESVALISPLLVVLVYLWVRAAVRVPVAPSDTLSDNPPLARLLAKVAKAFPRLGRLGALARGAFDRWLWPLVVVMIAVFVALTVYALGQFFQTLAAPIVVILAWWAWNCERPLTNRVYLFLVAAWAWIFVYVSSYLIAEALGKYLKLLGF